jgi:restriction system protein
MKTAPRDSQRTLASWLIGKVLSARLPFAVVGGEAVMARKKSLWSELQRERERRARAARAQERANQQLVRQMVQDAERAERRAERADAAERRHQEQLAHEAGATAAKEMKAQLDAQVLELKTLLTSALASPPHLPFAELKRSAVTAPFDPGELGQPLPVPVWEDFAPPAPGALAGLVGGKARHARAQETARVAFEQAISVGQEVRAEPGRDSDWSPRPNDRVSRPRALA